MIFQENVSFDHYFGTYPNAANTDGQRFHAAPRTPAVDGLPPATSHSLPPKLRHSTNLLTNNPNASQPAAAGQQRRPACPATPAGSSPVTRTTTTATSSRRLTTARWTTSSRAPASDAGTQEPVRHTVPASQVMDYYDGNTVTAMWNYAQNYSLERQLVRCHVRALSARRHQRRRRATPATSTPATRRTTRRSRRPPLPNGDLTPDGKGGFSLTNDAQPYWDDCSTRDAVAFKGTNIGDVLNRAGLSWGWFEGGFTPTTKFAAAAAATGHSGQPTSTFIPDEFAGGLPRQERPRNASNQGAVRHGSPGRHALGGTGQWGYKDDYIPHHEPFEYYASTANPHHLTVPVNGAGRDTVAASRGSAGTPSPTSRGRRSSTPPTTSTTPATSISWWRRSAAGSCRRRRFLPSPS